MAAPTPIGIDLGTTNCAVAYLDGHGLPQLVRNEDGATTTPSAVHFSSDGSPSLGRAAKDAARYDPANVALFFKREMGNRHYRPQFAGGERDAQELSALLLSHLRAQAQSALGELGPAIVTVPAYFRNSQREATLAAAREAGLQVARTINEPTAAAIAYGQQHPEMDGLVLVYDLGGGTFDVTLMQYSRHSADVIASEGNAHLGGVLWDERLINYVSDQFAMEHGEDPRDDDAVVADLRLLCEDAKKALSGRPAVRVSVSHAGRFATVPVTREVFESLAADLLEQTRLLMVQVMKAAQVRWPELSAVLLVGGSTRMPAVRDLVQALSRKEPLTDINPDECVAVGAALQAAADGAVAGLAPGRPSPPGLPSGTRTSRDVTPHSLGYVAISADGTRFINEIIIRKNTPIPTTDYRPARMDTTKHGPNVLDLYLLQGEGERVLDNEVLGQYEVTDVPHGTGKTEIEVGFAYDVSGVVGVTCRARGTGAELPVRVAQRDVDMSWTDLSPEEYAKQAGGASVVLLIDTSGSMSGVGITEAQRGAREFLQQLTGPSVRTALVEFGRSRGGVLQELTNDRGRIERAIGALSAGNGTPMTEGLRAAHSQLREARPPRVIVVLSDGSPANPTSALAAAAAIKDEQIRIVAIGAGSSVDREFLRKLASDPDQAETVDFHQLAGAFGRIAQAIGRSSSVQLKGLRQ